MKYTVLIPIYPSDLIKENVGRWGNIVPTSGSGVRFEVDGGKLGYGRTDEDNHIEKLGCNSYAIVNAADIQDFMRNRDIPAIRAWIARVEETGHYYFVLDDIYGEWSNLFQLHRKGYENKTWAIEMEKEDRCPEIENSGDHRRYPRISVDDWYSDGPGDDTMTIKSSNNATCERRNFMNFNTQSLFKNIKFGKADSRFALSFNNEVAFNGKYYDSKTNSVQDSLGLTLDIDGLLYIMPVQELKKGDIVVKDNDAFYYDGEHYISLTTGQIADYVPTKVLNMTFYSVVKNLAGNMFNSNGQMNNMLPFLLLGRDNDSDSLVKFMLLSQGGFNLFGTSPSQEQKK